MSEQTYPDCYLHVLECRSGQTWIVEIGDRATLNIRSRIARWVKQEFAGELKIDGALMPRLDGDYYAKIITDGRPPDSPIVWTSAGFYLTPTYK